MSAAKKVAPLPDWFTEPGRYAPPTGDDYQIACIWRELLLRAQALKTVPASRWAEIRDDQLRGDHPAQWSWMQEQEPGQCDTRFDRPPTDTLPFPGFLDFAPVTVLPREDLATIGADLVKDGRVLFPSMICLAVNLAAPPSVVMASLDQVMQRAWAAQPSLVKRRGPKALNGAITTGDFERWHKWRIVQVADIDWWVETLPKDMRPTLAQRCESVFDDAKAVNINQPAKHYQKARNVLRDAIAVIPGLSAHCLALSPARRLPPK